MFKVIAQTNLLNKKEDFKNHEANRIYTKSVEECKKQQKPIQNNLI